jgi:hypothetical protein
VTWDCSKGESSGKRKEIFKHKVLERRVGGAVGTCNKKPHILFLRYHRFLFFLRICFNKTWDFAIIFVHVHSNTKKQKKIS